MPVQSGSDKVLNDMKRGHTAKTFMDVVSSFRSKFPNFTISTDIIVGFPSESKADFAETIELLEKTRPDIVNLSKYSQRPGTEAATWKQVDVSEVRRRSKQVFELSRKISYENNKKWIGWNGDVLFDERNDEDIKGRNFSYKPIFVKDYVEIGERHQVTITDVTDHSLLGAIIS